MFLYHHHNLSVFDPSYRFSVCCVNMIECARLCTSLQEAQRLSRASSAGTSRTRRSRSSASTSLTTTARPRRQSSPSTGSAHVNPSGSVTAGRQRPKSGPAKRGGGPKPGTVEPPRHTIVPNVPASAAWAADTTMRAHAYGTGPKGLVVVMPEQLKKKAWVKGKQYACPHCGSKSTNVIPMHFQRGF